MSDPLGRLQDAGDGAALQLARLGAKQILIECALVGAIVELARTFADCDCPDGRGYFERCAGPKALWAPSADRYPIPGRRGGEYVVGNVRLLQQRCNVREYTTSADHRAHLDRIHADPEWRAKPSETARTSPAMIAGRARLNDPEIRAKQAATQRTSPKAIAQRARLHDMMRTRPIAPDVGQLRLDGSIVAACDPDLTPQVSAKPKPEPAPRTYTDTPLLAITTEEDDSA